MASVCVVYVSAPDNDRRKRKVGSYDG